jgi:hypothetical protein
MPEDTELTVRLIPKEDRFGNKYYIGYGDLDVGINSFKDIVAFVFLGDKPMIRFKTRRTRSHSDDEVDR